MTRLGTLLVVIAAFVVLLTPLCHGGMTMGMPTTTLAADTAAVGVDAIAMPPQLDDASCGTVPAPSRCPAVPSGSSGHRDVLMLCVAFLVATMFGSIGSLTLRAVCRRSAHPWVFIRRSTAGPARPVNPAELCILRT